MKIKIFHNNSGKALFCGLSLILIFFTGCKKLIEIDPPIQSITDKTIYESNSGAASVLTGIYVSMAENSYVHGWDGIAVATGLSGDELTLFEGTSNPNFINYYQNTANTELGNSLWASLYAYVYRVNSAIEGITASKGLSEPVKNQLLGEAKFIRAFCYFHLVNFYGDVPLLLSTDVKVNAVATRVNETLVYQQAIRDVTEAVELLNADYLNADAFSLTTERVRPNKFTAIALLSKLYLYTKEWEKSETEASKVLSNTSYSLLPLNKVFLKNSRETIWSLQSRVAGNNNLDGILFNFLASETAPSDNRPVYISEKLWAAFESGDNRKHEWIRTLIANGTTYPYANKYKTDESSSSVTEYPIMFRVSEQYLIRAEARAQQGKLTGANSAKEDIDIIRQRANLGQTNAVSLPEIIEAIIKERRVELFTEWGNRWFDLKRLGLINNIMQSVAPDKGAIWQPFKALYPIPAYDVRTNPNLKGKQNPGYPES